MRKTIVLSLLILAFAGTIFGQHTLIYTNSDVLFNQGKELFTQRKYAASYRSFEAYLKSTTAIQAGQTQEAEFYMAANAYELRQEDAALRLENYILQHPYTPFSDRTNVMLGMLRYEKKNYKQALTFFNQVKEKHLGNRERVDFLFCSALLFVAASSIPAV